MKERPALVLFLILLVGCAKTGMIDRPLTPPPATPCEEVIPECRAERLPNLILGPGTPDPEGGALGPVTGSLDRIISFDEAPRRAWQEDGYNAQTVQVVLGSADPESMNWDSEHNLFYGITWGGVCLQTSSLFPRESPEPCDATTAGTVIDAFTGNFIVGGTG